MYPEVPFRTSGAVPLWRQILFWAVFQTHRREANSLANSVDIQMPWTVLWYSSNLLLFTGFEYQEFFIDFEMEYKKIIDDEF